MENNDVETYKAKGGVLESEMGEYTFTEFKEYLASECIEHQLSILGRPE